MTGEILGLDFRRKTYQRLLWETSNEFTERNKIHTETSCKQSKQTTEIKTKIECFTERKNS